MPTHDRSLLEAALIGFGHQLAQVENAIAKLKRRIKASVKVPPSLLSNVTPVKLKPRKRRKVSAESRKKMAEAQKRRWAKVKKAK